LTLLGSSPSFHHHVCCLFHFISPYFSLPCLYLHLLYQFIMFYYLPSIRFRPSRDMPSFATMVLDYMPIYHHMNDQQRFSHVIRVPYYYGEDEPELVLQLPTAPAPGDASTNSTASTSTSTLSSTSSGDDEQQGLDAVSIGEPDSLDLLMALSEALAGHHPGHCTQSPTPSTIHSRLTWAIIDLAKHVQSQQEDGSAAL
jgi:hypothetical protein